MIPLGDALQHTGAARLIAGITFAVAGEVGPPSCSAPGADDYGDYAGPQ